MEWGPPGIFVELVNHLQVENVEEQWRGGRIPIWPGTVIVLLVVISLAWPEGEEKDGEWGRRGDGEREEGGEARGGENEEGREDMWNRVRRKGQKLNS